MLLAGKHELACRVLERLRARAGVALRVVLCGSEQRNGARQALGDLARAEEVLGDDPTMPLAWPVELFRPDLVISAGYDRIVTRDVLALIPRAVNIHFGHLPRYRGCWSIPWAILNNDDNIGVTLHEMGPSIDDGPIILQTLFSNDRCLGCRDLYLRGVDAGAKLLDCFLADPAVPAKPQDECVATYFPDAYPGNFRVPWKQTTTYVANYLRAAHFPPYPAAYTNAGATHIAFDWPAAHCHGSPNAPAGTVLLRGNRYWIATLNGIIGPGLVLVGGTRIDFSEVVAALSLEGHRLA